MLVRIIIGLALITALAAWHHGFTGSGGGGGGSNPLVIIF